MKKSIWNWIAMNIYLSVAQAGNSLLWFGWNPDVSNSYKEFALSKDCLSVSNCFKKLTFLICRFLQCVFNFEMQSTVYIL